MYASTSRASKDDLGLYIRQAQLSSVVNDIAIDPVTADSDIKRFKSVGLSNSLTDEELAWLASFLRKYPLPIYMNLHDHINLTMTELTLRYVPPSTPDSIIRSQSYSTSSTRPTSPGSVRRSQSYGRTDRIP